MGGGKLTCTENRTLQHFDNGNIEKICADWKIIVITSVINVHVALKDLLKFWSFWNTFSKFANFISLIFPFIVCFNLPQSWQHCMCDHVLNLYEVIFYSLKTISIFATVVYYGRVAWLSLLWPCFHIVSPAFMSLDRCWALELKSF